MSETSVKSAAFQQVLKSASQTQSKQIDVDGVKNMVPKPFPSPEDWRDCPIYFLLIDRFNNPNNAPRGPRWDKIYNLRHGGTFNGIRAQLKYIADLGMKAIWMTPVLKNAKPDWNYNYTGYGIQNFIEIDERFGTEKELEDLITEAHARGIYIVFDIVINHSARIFDYVTNDGVVSVPNPSVINCQMGDEYQIQWVNGYGLPNSNWQNTIPPGTHLSSDDAVYPDELRNYLFFRRQGNKTTDNLDYQPFIKGDFGDMRQMVVEYDATVPGQENMRSNHGSFPVLNLLIQSYQYLIAKFDCDGFRMDTVKYVHPDMIQTFGNAIREFALSIGKKNFFTFGEVWDNEDNIAKFVGRNGSNNEGFGVDAALDFCLFYKLPQIAKCQSSIGVEELRKIFEKRKEVEKELLSSHGEAGRFFVTFLENHDQKERFTHPYTPTEQITLGLAVLFCLQGIPCLYYGMEQGLSGTKKDDGTPELISLESVREALWGKQNAFDKNSYFYKEILKINKIRATAPSLRYGRFYFREVSKDGNNFGHSCGQGGIIAFSRILTGMETIIIANTHTKDPFPGFVWLDREINGAQAQYTVLYSNKGKGGTGSPDFGYYNIWKGEICENVYGARLYINLEPMEVQILGKK